MVDLAALFGTRYPLIQAPMAGVQGSALAIAVGQVGALGSLPAAMLSPDALRAELSRLREAGVPYNVNFFAHTPPAPDADAEARWRAALAPYFAELGVAADAPAGPGRDRHRARRPGPPARRPRPSCLPRGGRPPPYTLQPGRSGRHAPSAAPGPWRAPRCRDSR